MRFDSSGQLWSQINIFLLCGVIDINQHLTLGIRQVQGVVDVRPAALVRTGAAIRVLVSRLAAYLQGILVPRTELNYICVIIGEVNTVRASSNSYTVRNQLDNNSIIVSQNYQLYITISNGKCRQIGLRLFVFIAAAVQTDHILLAKESWDQVRYFS